MNRTNIKHYRNMITALTLFWLALCFSASTAVAEEAQPLTQQQKADQLLVHGVRSNDADKVRTSLKKGANPDSVMHHKYAIFPKNALTYAVRNGDVEIVNLLLDHGAYIDQVNGLGSSNPLSTAIDKGDKAMIKLLLERGADVNKNIGFLKNGRRPLHFAARSGNMELVQLLLKEGSEIMPNKAYAAARKRSLKMFDAYDSLLESAKQGENQEIYNLLERKGAI